MDLFLVGWENKKTKASLEKNTIVVAVAFADRHSIDRPAAGRLTRPRGRTPHTRHLLIIAYAILASHLVTPFRLWVSGVCSKEKLYRNRHHAEEVGDGA